MKKIRMTIRKKEREKAESKNPGIISSLELERKKSFHSQRCLKKQSKPINATSFSFPSRIDLFVCKLKLFAAHFVAYDRVFANRQSSAS